MKLQSCSLYGRCRDRNTGKLTKVSELHRDLLGLGRIQKAFTRLKANKAFYLSQSPKFLERYSESMVFTSEDADSEPKLASFYEAAKKIMPEVTLNDIRELLAKKFKEGVYSYENAYDKMVSFNQNMDGGASFIATLVPQKDGKYEFKIVPNSAQELESLILVISDRVNAEAIIQQLENLGVGIADGAKALYNSRNPQTLTNGLLGLITIAGGTQSAAYNIKDLASETGHTIVGMLGEENKLYQRLKKVVEEHPEAVQDLLGAGEFAAYLGTKNATKEFMGHLVGLYLEQWNDIKPNSKLKTIGNLIQRMVDWLRANLRFTDRDFYTARYEAKWTAYSMVKNFMGNNFQGTLQNALSSAEELEGDMNGLYKNIVEAILKIHEMFETSKDYGYNAHKNYKNTFHSLMGEVHELGLMQDEARTGFDQIKIELKTGEILLSIALFLSSEMKQTSALLLAADNGFDKDSNTITNSEMAKVIKYASEVLDLTRQVVNASSPNIEKIEDMDLRDAVSELFKALSNLCKDYTRTNKEGKVEEGSYPALIDAVRKKLALRLLMQINGSSFVVLSQHVKLDGLKVLRNAMQSQSIESILEHNITTSPISRWIDSLADSPDIVNLIIYDAVELKKHEANVKTLETKDKLFTMYQNLRKLGVRDTRRFYEVDSKGRLTGNFVSERNWGEWERLYKEDKEAFADQWYEANKKREENGRTIGWFSGTRADMYNHPIFLEAFGAWREGWHNDHSVKLELKDDQGNPITYADGKKKKVWAPAIWGDKGCESKVMLFDNEQWDKLLGNPALAEWFDLFMKLKRGLDELLPDGCTNALGVRAPLFMGTTTDKLTNVFRGDGSMTRVFGAKGMAMRNFILYNVSQNPSDTEYGGEHDTYNEWDLKDSNGSVIFTRAHYNFINSINRVPIFGVRKLPSPDDISTDLIQSTLAYAAMAHSYHCLDEVAEVASLVAEVRRTERESRHIVSKRTFSMGSWGYNRLNDYLNMLVYNNYRDPSLYHFIGPNSARLLRRFTGKVSSIGSLWMLGFNVHSAITNAYTGFNEIWKEAHGGEDFNKRDFGWACLQYIWYWGIGFLQNGCNIVFKDGSIIEATTKMHLFHKMYDLQNENERKFRDYHILTVGWNFMRGWDYTSIAMLPYTITDRWMQSIAFLATARHTKLKNKKDGKEYSVWDAYTVVQEEEDVVDKNGNIIKVKSEPKLVLKDVITGGRGDENDWLIFNKNQDRLNKIISKKAADGKQLTDAEVEAVYLFELVSRIERDPHDPSIIRTVQNYEIKIDPHTGEKMLIDPYVPFDNAQQTRFKSRCRGINNRMHGVYNRSDGGAFLKLAIASMAASMKKYAIGLIDRRFSGTRYDFRTGEMRQGSTMTMLTILADCFTAYSSGLDSKIIQFFDSLEFNWNVLGDVAKIAYGITKFFYIALGPSYTRFGVDQYLRSRGYSENQIANVRRAFGDALRPQLIKFFMSFVAPPDDDKQKDEDDIFSALHDLMLQGVDTILDSPPVEFIENTLANTYLEIMENSIFGDAVIAKKKDKVLTKKYLDRVVLKHNKNKNTGMFDIRGILYYQLYRGLLEQKAYDILRPLSMFKEYQGLTDSAIPGFTALYDIVMTAGIVALNVDEEELQGMSRKERKKFDNGKEIYTRGDYKYWYKYIKKLAKVTPTRTLEVWLNGYASKESMEHFKEPFSKDKHTMGEPNIARR